MKLTKADKEYFIDAGYLEEDLEQIEYCMNKCKYELEDGKKVSRKYVLENMDRREWLSGIGRSAFHWSAARETYNGYIVLFDRSF